MSDSGERIPSGWTLCKADDIGQLIRGISYQKQQASNSPGSGLMPILRANNINGSLNFEDLVYVPRSLIDANQHVQQGDIIFAMSSGSLHLVGKSAQALTDFDGSCGAFCAILRIDKNVFNKFAGLLFQGNKFRRKISEIAKGSNINNLKREHILEHQFALPPLAEQRRIVAKIEELFSELDKGIENLQQARAQLTVYRQSLLKHAFEGHLTADWRKKNADKIESAGKFLVKIRTQRRRKWEEIQIKRFQVADKQPPKSWSDKYKDPQPPKTDSLPRLPKEWLWTTADQICFQVTDGEHIQPRYTPVGFPMLTAKNVRDGFVDFADVGFINEKDFENCLKRCAPKKNDVLIVSVGATTGRAAIVGKCEPFAIVRSVLLLRPIITPRFLLRWIQSPWCQKYISRASGSSAQAHLYISDTKNIPIPLVATAEQEAILDIVEELLSSMEALESDIALNLQKAEALRQSILKKAFAGQLVPQDPNDEPASVLLERIRAERAAAKENATKNTRAKGRARIACPARASAGAASTAKQKNSPSPAHVMRGT